MGNETENAARVEFFGFVKQRIVLNS